MLQVTSRIASALHLNRQDPFEPAQEALFWQQQQNLAAQYVGFAALLAAFAYSVMTAWHVLGSTPELRVAPWFVPLRLLLMAAVLAAGLMLLNKQTSSAIRYRGIYCLYLCFALLPALQGPFRLPELNIYQGLSAVVGTLMLSAVVVRIPWGSFALIAVISTAAYMLMLLYASGAAMTLLETDYLSPKPPPVLFVQLAVVVGVALFVHRLVEWRERQLFSRSRQIEKLSAQRLHLLEALGHDLQQPLSALNLQSGIALTAIRAGRRLEAEQSMHHAERILQWAREELEQVTEVASLGDADLLPPVKDHRVIDLVLAVTNALQLLANKARMQLVVEVNDTQATEVKTNAVLFQRILSNLICNAIQHGQPPYRSTQPGLIRIALQHNQRHSAVRIRVVDCGAGIDPKEIEKIWQPFFRGTNIDRHTSPGHGIGLAMVRSAIDKLPEHAIKVRSEVKKGSCFELSVPIFKIDTPKGKYVVR
jgi:signal transduction histidine kinase